MHRFHVSFSLLLLICFTYLTFYISFSNQYSVNLLVNNGNARKRGVQVSTIGDRCTTTNFTTNSKPSRIDISKKLNMTKTGLSPGDPSSFARPEHVVVKGLHLALDVNFNKKVLSGRVDLYVEKVTPESNKLILDVKDLNISSIQDKNGTTLHYTIGEEVKPFGSKLTVNLPASPNQLNVSIKYETSPDAAALQWLTANQTAGKKYPYLFSQCQAIHARSMIPCQDTPSVKTPYTAEITAPEELTVLMSAIRSSEGTQSLSDGRKLHKFEQKVPIPSYLIALAVGAIESRKIGNRSHVWAEKQFVDDSAYEFAETELMLKTAEDICGEYVWGIYDLLVLPPSFPFGGMENPCLTFVTPTLLAGDRSLADVVAHEISHSWTGNLVTNRNFEHFWLNEGFTMFLEQKIIGRIHGSKEQDFTVLSGLSSLKETINGLGETNPLTSLVVDLRGVHPDDSFSTVPYQKGLTFLRYLEDLVGGPDVFEPFLRSYLNKYKYQSIDTNDFKLAFLEAFKNNSLVNQIEWDKWLYAPGMPPAIPNYDKTLADACSTLKDKWINWDSLESKSVFAPADISNLTTSQVIQFLQEILDSGVFPIEKLQVMQEVYNFDSIQNAEIRFRWIRIGLLAHWHSKIDDALKMVTEVGRLKYVRPLYRALYAWEEARPRAIETFLKNKKNMMYVTAYGVAQDLHLNEAAS